MSDIHTLAGAYVLDAVDDVERAAFRRHLAECEACAMEVAEFAETAGRLTELAHQPPPPALRDGVLAQISRTPQLGAGSPAGVDTAARAGQWRRRAALTLAAGIVAVAAAGGTFLVQEQRVSDERARADAAETRAERIDAVLSAADASLARATTGSGTVTVVGSRLRDQAVVVLELPAPGADQAYELWLGDRDGLTSAGVMPAEQGSTTALVEQLGDADLVGVSLEPAGGSPTGQPTPDQVVALIELTA